MGRTFPFRPFSVFMLLAAAGAVWLLSVSPPPSTAQGGGEEPVKFSCSLPPPVLDGWVRVHYILEDSGCPEYDGECWSNWIVASNPQAWYEDVDARANAEKCQACAEGDPPSIYRPFVIVDPRDECLEDERCGCEDGPAAGRWYVNRAARPVFVEYKDPDGTPIYECVWRLDSGRHYWFFGEWGPCRKCVCWAPPTPTPPPPPWPTAAPPPTECAVTPLPTSTPVPTPRLTPLPLTSEVEVTLHPRVSVRSSQDPNVWYKTKKTHFFWLWQKHMTVKLWADVIDVDAPDDCTNASATVVESYLHRLNGVEVCPAPNGPRKNPEAPDVVYHAEGWSGFCKWRTDADGDAIKLLWSKLPTPPSGESSLNQYNVTPFTQSWVPITYIVRVMVSYTCNGFAMSAPRDFILTMNVGLVKPVPGKKW